MNMRDDIRDDERYGIYAVNPAVGMSHDRLRRLAETSLAGIGLTLLTMLGLDPDGQPDGNEPEIARGERFGILDRRSRRWIVNPWT